MKHKFIFTLIWVFIPFLNYAQKPKISFVAIKQDGQTQTFMINNYPCLTISNINGVPTFNIKDKQHVTTSNVRTCVFKSITTHNNNIAITDNDKVNNQNIKKYVKNNVLYIEHNGNLYNSAGQRLK